MRAFLGDQGAVPPVVGVIPIVSLAAVVTTFAFAYTDALEEPPPGAAFSYNYTAGGGGDCDLHAGSDNDGVLAITHESGDVLEADRLTLVTTTDEAGRNDCGGTGDVVNATDSVEVNADDRRTIRPVWTAPDREQSAVIGRWDGERCEDAPVWPT